MEKEFNKALSKYQKEINREIEIFFNKEINQTKNFFFKENIGLLKKFSLRSAKRIRATLINCGYFLARGKNKKSILKTSIFIELIHNFLLIHDDIIDQDKFRRGGLTVQYQYQNQSSFKNKEKEHYGQSMAVVSGDLINSLGHKILSSSNFPEKYKIKAIEKLNQIIYFTCHGQMLELWLREKIRFNKRIEEKEILEIYRNKTALYTFIGPLQIGAILAGANEKFLDKLEKISLPLGIAFQIKDDIQEIFGSKKEIAKPLASDIREGQPNLLIIKTLENKKYGNIFRNYLNKKKINNNDLREIREILIKSNALQYCKKTIEKLVNQAKNILIAEKGFPKKEKQFLLNLADNLIEK